MQISNVSAPLPNTVAPFSVKVDPPSSGVTKDALASTFSPLGELTNLASGKNSLSRSADVYTPESLVQRAPANDVSSTSNSSINTSQTPSNNSIEDSADPAAENSGGQGADVIDDPQVAPATNQSEEGDPQFSGGGTGEEAPTVGQVTSDDEAVGQVETSSSTRLSPEDIEIIQELSARDREVRTHEQQHQSVGGQYAGSASFSYQTGPDGVQYAVGGEVPIDISSIPNNPQATIDKMRTVRNAALAPAEPSSQDRSVAAAANRTMLQAQSELANERAEERQIQAEKAEENREQRIEDREQQQERQKSINAETSVGVRAYESLIELGQQLDNGLSPVISLDEVV